MALHEISCADAGVFFIRYQREQDTAFNAGPREFGSGGHDCGGAALHIVGSPAIDSSIVMPAVEGRRHACSADSVEMRTENQCWAFGAANFGYGIGPAGGSVFLPRSDAACVEPVAGKLGDGGFPVRFIGRNLRVNGGDSYQ